MANTYIDQLKDTLMAYPVSAAISCIIGGAVLRELVRLCRRQPTRSEDAGGATSNAEPPKPFGAVLEAGEHRASNAEVKE